MRIASLNNRPIWCLSVAILLLGSIFTAALAADVVPPYKPTDSLKVTPVNLPQYTSKTLPNGLTVYLVEQHKLPTIAFRLCIKSGSLNDPAGQAGITNFAANITRDGATFRGKDLTATQISTLIDSVGGSLNAGANLSWIYASSEGLSRHSDLLLELLGAVLQRPTFPEAEVQRVKFQTLSQIMARRDQPDEMGRALFRKELYGDHPLGNMTEGDSASVSEFTRAKVVEMWSKISMPNNSVLAVVGDFDKSAMLKKISEVFGDWKKGTPPPQVPEANVNLKGFQVRLLEQPEAVQSNIRMGHQGVNRNDPRYYAITVMETILMAGDFDCRMMKEIRSKRGMTYGIGGGFRMDKLAGPMGISTSTKVESTGEMVKAVLDIIKDFQKDGPTDAELQQAKMFLTGSYPLGFETPDDIASQILGLDLMGLPAKTIPEYRMQIAKINKSDVKNAAIDLMHPDNMLCIIVGNNEKSKQQINMLGIPNTKIEQVKF